MFDKEALCELNADRFEDIEDGNLYLPNERISRHLNFENPPSMPYRYALYLLQDLNKKIILDYCCGSGETSVIIAKKGPALVESFDISPISVKVAKRRMQINRVEKIVNVQVMSAYSMTYPDEFFDAVYGNAVLHHLDLGIAMKGIWRVLKPGGKAIFCEPFAGSGSLKFMRKLIPIKGDLSPYERQLNIADIRMISDCFSFSRIKFLGLLCRLNRIIGSQLFRDIMLDFDYATLSAFPTLNKFAQSIVIEAVK
jgi:ubiquinone/menaquinone biosynthesis C-methylase UbiE